MSPATGATANYQKPTSKCSRYVVDDDDGDIVELGFDFCSPKCHWEQAEVWYLETTVGT